MCSPGQGLTLHIVVYPCKHDTDFSAKTVTLSTHTSYDKRTTPLYF